MPPINQQGSRGSLITAVVVFAILFVTSCVFAINFYGKWQTAQANYTAYQIQYKDIALPGAAQVPPVSDLLALRSESPSKLGITQSDTAIDVAIKQRDALATAIVGSLPSSPASSIVDQANDTISHAQKTLDTAGVKCKLPTVGLEKAIETLKNTAVSSQQTIASLNARLKDEESQLTAAKTETATVNSTREDELKAEQTKAADDLAKAQAAVAAKDAVIQGLTSDQSDAGKKAADQVQELTNQVSAANQQVTKANQQIEQLKSHFAARRVDVENAVIRQGDGKIVRVPNTEVCYINLGEGNQVTPGLTFEVYDKADGVPPIPPNVTGDEQLPVGKGSIEITHVGTNSSECRIVNITPGAIITEGDVIANLVYDPHTKYNFLVYGNFDLAGNGRPNAADADVIKRLVTQWGGKLTDKVDVDTDFVVMGIEPVVPSFSKDDLTPENTKKIEDSQKALDDYQEILSQAKDLHIPILNQNRFLYYVGFYDQAKR
jgi:predicted  nucleic acid-binding Zn-ribbon protein